jgi:hypothetical protein
MGAAGVSRSGRPLAALCGPSCSPIYPMRRSRPEPQITPRRTGHRKSAPPSSSLRASASQEHRAKVVSRSSPPSLGEVRLLRSTPKHQLFLVAFQSPNDRLGERNRKFWLRCTIPQLLQRSLARGLDSLVIMLNGLGEADITPYDEIADDLATYGIASIMLPLPNHFCRYTQGYLQRNPFRLSSPDPFVPVGNTLHHRKKTYRDVADQILKRLEDQPHLWIEGYEQAMGDVLALIDVVRGLTTTSHGGFWRYFWLFRESCG